jgi:hypothetical protein
MKRSRVIPPPEVDPDPTDRLPEPDDEAVQPADHPLETTSTWSASTSDLVARIAELEGALEQRDAAVAGLAAVVRQLRSDLEAECAARAKIEQDLARRRQEPPPPPQEPPPPPQAPAEEAPRLLLERLDEGREAVHELAGPRVSIGRTHGNDLQVLESYISRSHAVIRLGGGEVVIEDAGSRNGVFVNDRRVSREQLHDGDIVVLGKARFRFRVASPG